MVNDWISLVVNASSAELESLLQLYNGIAARRPAMRPEQVLDYATEAERASIERIRARIEGRLQQQPVEEPVAAPAPAPSGTDKFDVPLFRPIRKRSVRDPRGES